MKTNFRILTASGLVKFTGTSIGSWFTLDKAKSLVNYSDGESIYEYDTNGERLWEVF